MRWSTSDLSAEQGGAQPADGDPTQAIPGWAPVRRLAPQPVTRDFDSCRSDRRPLRSFQAVFQLSQ
jgi:hypothetical protein